ncbi:MAG: response regulator, partial [Treponema sp.]|nr:response regulator [Treponema sp.]
GSGSTFTFTVKMRISDDEAGNKLIRDHKAIRASDVDLKGYTAMLVEDVEINREIVYAMLEDTHISMESAENGVIAVQMFADNPEKYDIILMDLQMPVMDGLEATRRIRALGTEKARNIAIVAMTANVFREDVDKCLAAGMNDHIAKPIDNNQLLEKLIQYLYVH